MVFDDLPCAQVRTIDNRVSISDHDDRESPLDRRMNGGIDAHIRSPTADQDALWIEIHEVCFERRTHERAVQILANEAITWLRLECIEDFPAGRIGCKRVTPFTVVLNEEDAATVIANASSNLLDSPGHGLEVVFRVALENPDLHIYDQKDVHTRFTLPPQEVSNRPR